MAKNLAQDAGKEAIEKFGWWRAHRFLILRRLCQLTIIALFMAGPTLGVFRVIFPLACCSIRFP